MTATSNCRSKITATFNSYFLIIVLKITAYNKQFKNDSYF